jgi:hypothetical protein
VEKRFSASFQTGPGARPAPYKMGTEFLYGGKAAGAWPLPSNPSSADVKERVELFPYSHSCSRVNFTFTMEQLANIKLCFRGYRKQKKYFEVFEEMDLYLVRVSSNDLKD